MTNIELSKEIRSAVIQRQNGMCAISGKKFENEENEVKFLHLDPTKTDIDNFVAVWTNADLSNLKVNNEIPTPLPKYHFPYANFSNYTIEDKINDLNLVYEKIRNLETTEENLRNHINQFRNIIKLSNNLGIEPQNWPLYTEIENKLKELEERNQKLKNEINEASAKFFEKYKAKIDELLKTPNKWLELRNARQKLVALQKEINANVSKISKSTVEEVKKLIADAISTINARQIQERENYEMECSDNYLQLKNKFEAIIASIPTTKDYAKTRQELIEAQKSIATKTLKRNHQEELYQIIRNGFDQLTKIQEADKANFLKEANENYQKLLPLVENAINIAQNADTFKEAREALIAAQTSIKGLTLTKEQRDELFGKIREVFEKINVEQEQERNQFFKESEENFQKLLSKINAEKEKLFNNPHFKTIRENLLTIQSEIKVWKLKTESRNKLYEVLKDAFKTLDEKRNEFFEAQKAQKNQKVGTLLKNLKTKLEKLQQALELDKEELTNMEKQILDAPDSQKAELEKRIEIIKSKIDEKEKRIEETEARIKEIEQE